MSCNFTAHLRSDEVATIFHYGVDNDDDLEEHNRRFTENFFGNVRIVLKQGNCTKFEFFGKVEDSSSYY
jgi:hypothetical protein